MMNIKWLSLNIALMACTAAISTQMGFNVLTWQHWVLLIIVGTSNIAGFKEGLE